MIEIKFDGKRMERLIKGLRSLPHGYERAATRSINRTLVTVRKEVSTRIREDYNVKARAIKEDMVLRKATFSSLEGSLSAEGSPGVPLVDYQQKARITPGRVPSTRWQGPLGKKKAGPQRGISLAVRMGRRRRIKGSFVNRMPSGHIGVFRRVPGKKMRGGKKPAIRELYGPSAARTLTGGRYQENLEELVNETMSKNISRELNNLLRKLGT